MMRFGMVGLMLTVGIWSGHAEAYGPRGHRMVGAIADQRLGAKPVATTISDLLDEMTLADAALLPDKIKAWEKQKRDRREIVAPGHSEIEKQLHAFFDANPFNSKDPTISLSHHWFHYTDVPVVGDGLYKDGKTGRTEYDIVQMIPFCCEVLKGKHEGNSKKITKTIAVILLAHYLGDIHQPLHVGAQYFDKDGNPTNPDKNGEGFDTHGGNNINLILNDTGDHGRGNDTGTMHHYWDNNAVTTAMNLLREEILSTRKSSKKLVNDKEMARFLAIMDPKDWKASAMDVNQATEDWANETLALARLAYGKVEYRDVKINKNRGTATAVATEPAESKQAYSEWAGEVVRHSVHKGGWRLAEILERTLE